MYTHFSCSVSNYQIYIVSRGTRLLCQVRDWQAELYVILRTDFQFFWYVFCKLLQIFFRFTRFSLTWHLKKRPRNTLERGSALPEIEIHLYGILSTIFADKTSSIWYSRNYAPEEASKERQCNCILLWQVREDLCYFLFNIYWHIWIFNYLVKIFSINT